VVGIDVRHLGEYIREQRSASDISLRQLAKLAGVSNPYLSQIERGLRKPSAEILQQIAKALRISAEALYVQAGILEHREGSGQVADAVLTDDGLNERQKQVLLEIYDAFRKENAAAPAAAAEEVAVSLVTATTALPDEALSTAPTTTAPPEPGAAGTSAAAPAAPRKSARTAAGKAAGKAAGSAARKAAGTAARKVPLKVPGAAKAVPEGDGSPTPGTEPA
jgi:transcriptional regulator with XRE-family HTH domain